MVYPHYEMVSNTQQEARNNPPQHFPSLPGFGEETLGDAMTDGLELLLAHLKRQIHQSIALNEIFNPIGSHNLQFF